MKADAVEAVVHELTVATLVALFETLVALVDFQVASEMGGFGALEGTQVAVEGGRHTLLDDVLDKVCWREAVSELHVVLLA